MQYLEKMATTESIALDKRLVGSRLLALRAKDTRADAGWTTDEFIGCGKTSSDKTDIVRADILENIIVVQP